MGEFRNIWLVEIELDKAYIYNKKLHLLGIFYGSTVIWLFIKLVGNFDDKFQKNNNILWVLQVFCYENYVCLKLERDWR